MIGPLIWTSKPNSGQFNGTYLREIIIIGENKREVVQVKEIPFTSDDNFMKEAAALGG